MSMPASCWLPALLLGTIVQGASGEAESAVTDLQIVAGSYDNCPEGFSYIPIITGSQQHGDLNEDAGGKDIYLCVDPHRKSTQAINDIIITSHSTCPPKYSRVATSTLSLNGDLNEGAGGKTIYMCYTRDAYHGSAYASKITSVAYVGTSAVGAEKKCFETLKDPCGVLSGDLNEGAGGKDIFMCLMREYSFEKIADGICDWHYLPGALVTIDAEQTWDENDLADLCAGYCAREPDCEKFSVVTDTTSAAYGCRYSKCGSNPGDAACPSDKQCSAASGHGGKIYKVTQKTDATVKKATDAAITSWCADPNPSDGSSQVDSAISSVHTSLVLIIACSSFYWF